MTFKKFIKNIFNFIIDFFKSNSISDKNQQFLYKFVLLITWILYIFSILGLFANGIKYFNEIQKFILIYVSLFIVFKFNPIIKHSSNRIISKFDKEIIFHAGIFILFSTLLNSVVIFLNETFNISKYKYQNILQNLFKKFKLNQLNNEEPVTQK